MSDRIAVVGVSWRNAPVVLREQLAFRPEELASALDSLRATQGIDEAMILSTCNRVEIYAAGNAGSDALRCAAIRSFLHKSRQVSPEVLTDHGYEHQGDEALLHLFRVASALDSMVLGETQILGQLKQAYGTALDVDAVGSLLGRPMERCFAVAKRVRTETGLSRGSANVSSVAVELAEKVFGELRGRSVLIVGAGKMSALAGRHLRAAGVAQLVVTNRSPERALLLAQELEATAAPWEDLERLLIGADVVLSSTAATEPIHTRARFKRVLRARRYRPLVLVDIAVPRDCEPGLGRLDGLYVFDIDDLEKVVASHLSERAAEASSAEEIVAQELRRYQAWVQARQRVPTLRSLRDHFHGVADAEVDRTLARLGDSMTDDKHRNEIEQLARRIVNKLLHQPSATLRSQPETQTFTLESATTRLFGLRADEEDIEDAVSDIAPGVAEAGATRAEGGSR